MQGNVYGGVVRRQMERHEESQMNPAKYLVEFIGTFFLVATIGAGAGGARREHMAPLAVAPR